MAYVSLGVPRLQQEFQYHQISLPPESGAAVEEVVLQDDAAGSSSSWLLSMLPKLKGGAHPPASAPSKHSNAVIVVHY
ncbi:hypothetical protein LINGRAHAP2_LOCUS27752 [Linum grandiflorum]